MIERKIISQKMKEFEVQEYIAETLKKVGNSHIKMQKTPLGEKITIFTSRPGLVVGRKGQSIKKLTKDLKRDFKLENPQIEISEVENINLNAQIIAEKLASALERFGVERFKGLGHSIMANVMEAGALGIEILISGKVPSQRARRWRFYQGYLKKCGDLAIEGVKEAYSAAKLKSGVVGIQVRIMPPDIRLPDNIIFKSDLPQEESAAEEKTEKKETKKKKTTKKKSVKKAATKKKVAKKKSATKEKEE